MREPDAKCPRCLKPLESKSGGFITQFIDLCTCHLETELDSSLPIRICQQCIRPINEKNEKNGINAKKTGSITQFIFSANYCDCQRPHPIDRNFAGDSKLPYIEDIREESEHADEVELPVEKHKFPFERYKVFSILGAGSTGNVYLCQDKLLAKKVAVKILRQLNPDLLMAFQEEARATSKLNHPNLVTVLDFGATEAGFPYMVMEYVPGVNLRNYLDEKRVMDPRAALRTISFIAEALVCAHKAGIYHRDIKPSNIILVFSSKDGPEKKREEIEKAVLIDFGIAKVVKQETDKEQKCLAGTPSYMSPDTVSGLQYDERSEIYSLACVLYELIKGSPPFVGNSAIEILGRSAMEKVPPLTYEGVPLVSPELEKLVERCLSPNKQERIGSMSELLEAIEAILQAESEKSSKDATIIESSSYFKKNYTNTPNPNKLSRRFIQTLTMLFVAQLLVTGAIFFYFSRIGEQDKNEKCETGKLARHQTKSKKPQISSGPHFWLCPGQSPEVEVSSEFDDSMMPQLIKVYGEQSRWNLSGSRITDKSLSCLKNSPVNYLALDACNISGEGLVVIAGFPELHELMLQECDLLEDADLQALQSIKELVWLTISGNKLTGTSLEYLSKIDSLQNLEIGPIDMSTEQFASLCRLPRLDKLTLKRILIDNELAGKIAGMKNLRSLSIRDCRSESGSFSRLSASSNIEFIQITQPTPPVEELLALKKLKSLKQLKILRCTLTLKEQALIKKSLPFEVLIPD